MELMKYITILAIYFCLIGCAATQIKPFKEPTEKTRFEMAGFKDESDEILNISLRSLIPERGHILLKDNCISRSTKVPTGDVKSVKFCYYVNLAKQKIQRKNVTTCRKSNYMVTKFYTATGEACGFTNLLSGFIDTFTSNDLVREYNKNSDKFLSYYKEFIEYSRQVDRKIGDIKVHLNDNAGVLSPSEINQASNYSWLREHVNVVKSSQTNADFADSLKLTIQINMKGIDKRYSLNSPKTLYVIDPEIQSDINFHIDEILFNYIPYEFETGDDKLNVKVNNLISSSGRLKGAEITVENKSKNFIVISEFAGYYNENVVSNLIPNLEKSFSIPPQSLKKITMSHDVLSKLYSSGLVQVKQRNKKVNYGFSIQYETTDGSGKKDLFEVNQFGIDDLLNQKG